MLGKVSAEERVAGEWVQKVAGAFERHWKEGRPVAVAVAKSRSVGGDCRLEVVAGGGGGGVCQALVESVPSLKSL